MLKRGVARLLVLMVAASCSFLVLIPSGSSGASTASAHSALTIRILLGQTRTTAGQDIKGFGVITNHTSKRITVEACVLDGWLYVGLANRTITYNPVIAQVACAPTVQLHPGVNGFPIEVLTTFLQCGGKPITVNDPPLHGQWTAAPRRALRHEGRHLRSAGRDSGTGASSGHPPSPKALTPPGVAWMTDVVRRRR
jgi:hypothetical protein